MWIAYLLPTDIDSSFEGGIPYVAKGNTELEALANLANKWDEERKKIAGDAYVPADETIEAYGYDVYTEDLG
jgi:hypothetical protein